MKIKINWKRSFLIFGLLLALVSAPLACSLFEKEKDDNTDQLALLALASLVVTPEGAATNYENLAFRTLLNSVTAARTLKTAIDSFAAAPSPAGLTAAQNAYRSARQTYLLTEAFRFSSGPVDNSSVFTVRGEEAEGLLNAWPVDEAGINAVLGNTDCAGAGMTQNCVAGLNGGGGDDDVTIGWHAIEFLLWGSDGTAGGNVCNATAGTASSGDFAAASTTGATARRSLYLQLATNQLIADLESVAGQWNPSVTGNYYSRVWANLTTNQKLTNIYKGLASFMIAEYGGERMNGLTSASQNDDEHSCFSDLTKDDFYYGAQGVIDILNSGVGRLGGDGGAGAKLVQVRDAYSDNTAFRYDQVIIGTCGGDAAAVKARLQNIRVVAVEAGRNIEALGKSLGLSFTPES